MEQQNYFLEIADALDKADRMGAERDVPEGACYITLSDTLAKEIATKLRELGNLREFMSGP